MGCGASSAPKAKYASSEGQQDSQSATKPPPVASKVETTPALDSKSATKPPPVDSKPDPTPAVVDLSTQKANVETTDNLKAAPPDQSVVPPTAASQDEPIKTPTPIITKSNTMSSKGSLQRRPSFDADVVEGHEAQNVMTRENDEGAPMQRLSVSKVQTDMELWWMSAIPAMFGVSDSDELSEELQDLVGEDAQADYVKKVVQAPRGEVTSILMEWLKDCTNEQARQEFVDRVLKELGQIDDTKKVVKKVQVNVTPGAEKRGKLLRKGTGFVSSGQVRQLACQDMVEEESGSSDEDEKDDEEFEREMERQSSQHRTRAAVSSEAYKVDANWNPPVYPKTPEQHQRIADAVSESFMFAALGFDQLEQVIKAFEEVKVEAGTKVIEQNADVGATDRGLYVLESGELEVFKNGRDSPVFTYTEMGQYFGDLALLYNAPRAATVIASKPCTLWSIDRTTFNCLVKDAAQKAKERRFTFLSSVEILQNLDQDEVAKINDALRERTFGTGVHIITEGEDGEEFFILENGSAAAIKEGVRVKEYVSSDYFGELALLKNEPRAADVVTLSDCTVLSLRRDAFHRLLGPLDTILQERAKTYDESRPV